MADPHTPPPLPPQPPGAQPPDSGLAISAEAGNGATHRSTGAGPESDIRGQLADLAGRLGPAARESGRLLGTDALKAGKWAAKQLEAATRAAQVRGAALAQKWAPLAKEQGKSMMAAAQSKSTEWLSVVAERSAGISAQFGRHLQNFLKGAPVEAELLDCLRAAGYADAAADLQRQLLRLDDPVLRVVVFGEFSAGKSTLLNALLGESLLHEAVVPSTGQVTRLVHDPERKAAVLYTDGTLVDAELGELRALTTLDEEGHARADIEEVRVGVTSPLLEGVVSLIDTPGSGDPGRGGTSLAEQVARTQGAFLRADAVVWVLHSHRLLRDTEMSLTESWLASNPSVQLVPVINFMGTLSENDRESVRARAAFLLQNRFAGNLDLVSRHSPSGRAFLEVDAASAQMHPCSSSDDFTCLKNFIAWLNIGGGEAARVARAGRLKAFLTSCQAELAVALQADKAVAEQEIRAHSSRIQNARERERHFDSKAELLWSQLSGLMRQTFDNHLEWLAQEGLAGKKPAYLQTHGAMESVKLLGRCHTQVCDMARQFMDGLAAENGLTPPRALKPVIDGSLFRMGEVQRPFWFGEKERRAYNERFVREVARAWHVATGKLGPRVAAWWASGVAGLRPAFQAREVDAHIDTSGTDITHVEIKAREIRLRKGRRQSLGSRINSTDHEEAYLHLRQRAQAGERLPVDKLHREALEAALSAAMAQFQAPREVLGAAPPPLP